MFNKFMENVSPPRQRSPQRLSTRNQSPPKIDQSPPRRKQSPQRIRELLPQKLRELLPQRDLSPPIRRESPKGKKIPNKINKMKRVIVTEEGSKYLIFLLDGVATYNDGIQHFVSNTPMELNEIQDNISREIKIENEFYGRFNTEFLQLNPLYLKREKEMMISDKKTFYVFPGIIIDDELAEDILSINNIMKDEKTDYIVFKYNDGYIPKVHIYKLLKKYMGYKLIDTPNVTIIDQQTSYGGFKYTIHIHNNYISKDFISPNENQIEYYHKIQNKWFN